MRTDALYLAGIDETRFLSDELIQSAVLQKLSVIGEVVARLSDATRNALPNIAWK